MPIPPVSMGMPGSSFHYRVGSPHTHDKWVLIYYLSLYLSRLLSSKARPWVLLLRARGAYRWCYMGTPIAYPSAEYRDRTGGTQRHL